MTTKAISTPVKKPAYIPPKATSSADAVKITRMLLKADKQARELQTIGDLGRTLIASPLVQVVGVILACEWMENKEDPWISSGWATGIEAGSIALVGLHVLKEYGLTGVGIAGAAGLTGAAVSEKSEGLLSKANMSLLDFMSGAANFPGAVLSLIRALF